MGTCAACDSPLATRWQKKYCSNRCQLDHQHKVFIERWRHGELLGSKELATKNISGYIKRYLLETSGEKCSLCGWHKRHSVSGKVPLEVDHIDGDAENNAESNLRLLCPNCHALTPNFKNLNRGKGRIWRRQLFAKNGKKPSL
jgi:hypothetical protein